MKQKFTPKTAKQIMERDEWCCIICGSPQDLTAHHVYWHALERIYDGTQNDPSRGVTLCFTCHRSLHDGDKDRDLFCHRYLDDI